MKAAALLGLILLPAVTIAQPAGTPKRLISQALYISSPGGLRLHDSAAYTYSARRSARFDPNFLRYIDLQQLGTSPDADHANQRVPAHNIDSSSLPRVDYDSALFAIGIPENPPNALRSLEGHRYDATGAITRVYSRVLEPSSGNQRYGQHSVDIYSGGRLNRSYILGFNGVSYDTSFIRDFVYNGAGQLILDSLSIRLSFSNYIGYRKISYAYGSAAGYISSTIYNFRPSPSRLVANLRDSLSYYPDQTLRTRKSFFMGNHGNFLPEYLDSFGYTPGVAGFSYLREQLLDTLGAPDYTYYTATDRLNLRGQKDSVTVTGYYGTQLLGNNRIVIDYDTAGDPLSRTEYFSSLGPMPYSVEYYRYEPVPQAGVGLPEPADQVQLGLSPNPCRESLSYTLDGVPAGTGIDIAIYNISGQLVHRESRVWTGVAQRLVLGAEAPPGQYILELRAPGAAGRTSRQFTRL